MANSFVDSDFKWYSKGKLTILSQTEILNFVTDGHPGLYCKSWFNIHQRWKLAFISHLAIQNFLIVVNSGFSWQIMIQIAIIEDSHQYCYKISFHSFIWVVIHNFIIDLKLQFDYGLLSRLLSQAMISFFCSFLSFLFEILWLTSSSNSIREKFSICNYGRDFNFTLPQKLSSAILL
jgi:hypothetical protein